MESHAHVIPARTYVMVLSTLLVLTVITVLAAGVHFGSPAVNVVVALVIATIKGSLVAMFFMHLKYDKPLNAIVFVAGLAFLCVFLIFCFIDTGSRDRVRPATGGAAVLSAPAAQAAPPSGVVVPLGRAGAPGSR